jgi:hypothetical protein
VDLKEKNIFAKDNDSNVWIKKVAKANYIITNRNIFVLRSNFLENIRKK